METTVDRWAVKLLESVVERLGKVQTSALRKDGNTALHCRYRAARIIVY